MPRETGIDAIIVSNHGGRADEAGRSTIESLPEIIKAAGKMPALIDSGFRRGTDFVKALCMGAKGVAIGRPYLWGSVLSASRAWSACCKSCERS